MLAYIALLPLAQNVTQPIRRNIQCAMQIVRSGRDLGEPLVEVSHEYRQERVGRLDVRYAGEAQFLHEAVLQRPIDPFDPALAWLELAHRISMLNSDKARPN